MSLQNLLNIGLIKEHPADAAEVQRLLAAARRSLADAAVTSISPESRSDIAYRAVMQSALAAMMANGYRPDTNKPGHHVTMIQGLSLTVELASARVLVLDTLRRTRNLADYTGQEVDDTSANHCIVAASQLLQDVVKWIRSNRPELLADGER